MIRRRDVLLGGLSAATMGAAALAVPRRKLAANRDVDLDKAIPKRFGPWEIIVAPDNVLPQDENSLAAQLYSQLVSRVYVAPGQPPIMMVVAYGDTQSDTLQLHRPEVCYVAAGFKVSPTRAIEVPVAGGSVDAVYITAEAAYRYEQILYWTRLGDELPRNRWDQQMAKFRAGLKGVVPDGTLVRVSTITQPGDPMPEVLNVFVRQLLQAVSPKAQAALIGRSLAT